MGLFPESFYNNTLPKKLAKKEKEIPLLKDIKQDIETGKFILDDKGDFIIVEGIEALLQIVVKKLNDERGKWIIYSKEHGSRLYALNGKSSETVKMYVKQFIDQAIVDKVYISEIKDLQIIKEKATYYTIEFTIVSIYGNKTIEYDIDSLF